ncbi:MAG TPA: TonB-dependent receptor [Burkholderiaceae bacterium]
MRLPINGLVATVLAAPIAAAHGQATPPPAAASAPQEAMQRIVVTASADASAQGLSPAYPGGQVARGGRAGILGTRDNMETPFSITAYTNELIQDRQAKSVGDVLQNDPGVRTARGFGNFQEAYFIRGFILSSDDVAYNGLYSLLPRQYIATELFERVEVLRGASAFLIGANPGGGGIGGAINLLPKRATNEPLNRVVLGVGSGGQGSAAADLSRRFGPDGATGVRVNLAYRGGNTAVDDEKAQLALAAVGFDWRSRDVRLSADLGWQDNRLKETRPNVSLRTPVPRVPDGSRNFAQPWSYSNEKDLFGTLRAEWDLAKDITAWAAYGLRRSEEANSLANPTVTDATTGAATTSRFDNTREDRVDTGELGLRGKLRTGSVGHEWVATAAYFKAERDNAFGFGFFPLATNIYTPTAHPQPSFSEPPGAFLGGDLADPRLTGITRMTSLAIGDTLSMLDDSLLVTLGLRRQTIDLSNFAYGTAALIPPRYDQSRNSPALAIVFRGGKEWSVYANYIEGLTQGDTAGSVTLPLVNAGQMLPPYASKQTEVGAKMDLGRLGGSVAVFSTSRPRSLIVNNVFTSEGEDVHKGVELNVYGEATRGLRVLGGATWLDAKQKSTGVPATDGKRVIGVPEAQANLGVEWELPMPGLAVDGRVVYTGSSYADALNLLKVPGWTRFDVGVRFLLDIGSTALTLRARIDNLFDRDHWASVGGYPGDGYLVVGQPRTFNLSASVDF